MTLPLSHAQSTTSTWQQLSCCTSSVISLSSKDEAGEDIKVVKEEFTDNMEMLSIIPLGFVASTPKHKQHSPSDRSRSASLVVIVNQYLKSNIHEHGDTHLDAIDMDNM